MGREVEGGVGVYIFDVFGIIFGFFRFSDYLLISDIWD